MEKKVCQEGKKSPNNRMFNIWWAGIREEVSRGKVQCFRIGR